MPESCSWVVGLAVVDRRLVTRVDGLEIAALVSCLLDHARERGARLHRGLDVDDRIQWLVVDEDELGTVLGRGFGLGDDERDRLTGEDDLLAREGLRRPIRAGRREREVGGEQHGDYTRDRESRVLVHASDARVRLGREHGARVQQAVDVAVRRIPGRAGDLVRCVDSGSRDADEVRSRVLRSRARASARSATTTASSRRYSSDAKRSPKISAPAMATRGSPAASTNGVALDSGDRDGPRSGVTSAAAPASANPEAGCSTEA